MTCTFQYVKQETLTVGKHGKEARATRLITELASRRIGKMAYEIALARARKVSLLFTSFCHPFIKPIASNCDP